MRKLIIAGIAFVLLLGGFIVYMEIDKRKFIDNISAVSEVVDQPVNVLETTREVTRANEEPKFQEVDPAELIAAVNQIPEQFGYSEAATTYAKLETKRMNGEKLTIDESVARLEAQLYLYPSEATRRSLILQKWIQSKGPNYNKKNMFSPEAIEELRELGIPVVRRGNIGIINPTPDTILKEREEELREIYAHMLNDPEYFSPRPSAAESISSKSIDEDIDLLPSRSELLVTPEPQVLDTLGHVHESPTIQPPKPTDPKSTEADGWEGLSSEQRGQAKQLFDQYGPVEGLRRLRKMDPEAARHFESDKSRPGRGRRPSEPSRDAPSGDDYSDDQPPVGDSRNGDDSP